MTAQEADRLRFVANVSHELRGPLHAILGLSELLVNDGLAPEHHRSALTIHREAEALRTMIDDLLDHARVSSDEMQLEVAAFSPAQAVAHIVESTRPSLVSKPVTILFSVEPDVPLAVMGDEGRYSQIVRNLVTNAARYTDEGTVLVQLLRDERGRLVCEVRDTGIGIAPDALERLFIPFVQVHSNRPGGTGLGLALVDRLVDLMAGEIVVSSTLGSGSTFRVAVPLPVGDSVPADDVSKAAETSRSGRILVVEDSPVNQLLAASQLDHLGYEAVIVGDGEAAVELAANEPFDAILMDWNLPGIDGLEATARIRTTPRGRTLPIIAMTANALTGDRERCIGAGMNDFLSKPVGIDGLRAVLERTVIDVATPPADLDHTCVDIDILDTLAAELGDRATVETLIRTFIAEIPERVERIVATVDVGDLTGARRAAHTLKSTSALLGAIELSTLCGSLCEVGDDDPNAARGLASAIEREVADVSDVLASRLSEESTV